MMSCDQMEQIFDLGLFSVVVSTYWNSLPDNVKSANIVVTFWCHLKTHIFNMPCFYLVSIPAKTHVNLFLRNQ